MAESIINAPYREFPQRTLEAVTTLTGQGAMYTVQDEGTALVQITSVPHDSRYAQVYVNSKIVLMIGADSSTTVAPSIQTEFPVHPGDIIYTRGDFGTYYIQVRKYV